MTTRELSEKHEKTVAKSLGGVRASNSGATPFTKGDVLLSNAIIECKTKMTPTNSFSIQKDWLTTLEEERRGMGKALAALAFSFDCGEHSYYIINENALKDLLEVINQTNM